MSGLGKTKIGYVGTGADGRAITFANLRGWNPMVGCTRKCPGCYARAFKAGRAMSNCLLCNTFTPHIHKDRLDQPQRADNAQVVLVNFFADTLGPEWARGDIYQVLYAANAAPQHTYVLLTQNPARATVTYETVGGHVCFRDNPNWFLGCTIRDQADADAKLPTFLSIPGNLWISYEPARGSVDWKWRDYWEHDAARGRVHQPRITGAIIGHDNRKGAPGTDTLDHIRGCRAQCMDAGISSFVKQVWIGGKLLHASKPSEYALYPEDLRGGRLPWSAPGGA